MQSTSFSLFFGIYERPALHTQTDNATGSSNGSARDKERLDGESDHNHVQFAIYPEGEKPINSIGAHPVGLVQMAVLRFIQDTP